MDSLVNEPFPGDEPKWKSEGIRVLPSWAEPVIVSSIIVGALYITQRRNYQIFSHENKYVHDGLLDDPHLSRNSNDITLRDDLTEGSVDSISTSKHPPKRRQCCGMVLNTPNSSRFAGHLHSRIAQKIPFLMELIYWTIICAFFGATRWALQVISANMDVWDIAQEHGLAILEFEQFTWLKFLWLVKEVSFQKWFLTQRTFLSILNLLYTLVDIAGYISFIAWYYYAAPSFNTFATVRRTLILANLIAFCISIIYPCLSPRLLSEEYGFIDPTHQDTVQSVWTSGKYIRILASMPSMQYGHAFCVGCTLVYHSSIFRQSLEPGEVKKSIFWKSLYLLIAISYPTFVVAAIVATGNHYWLDACTASLVIIVAFLCNRVLLVFLSLEDFLFWCLRIDKPIPSTGERFHTRLAQ